MGYVGDATRLTRLDTARVLSLLHSYAQSDYPLSAAVAEVRRLFEPPKLAAVAAASAIVATVPPLAQSLAARLVAVFIALQLYQQLDMHSANLNLRIGLQLALPSDYKNHKTQNSFHVRWLAYAILCGVDAARISATNIAAADPDTLLADIESAPWQSRLNQIHQSIHDNTFMQCLHVPSVFVLDDNTESDILADEMPTFEEACQAFSDILDVETAEEQISLGFSCWDMPKFIPAPPFAIPNLDEVHFPSLNY
ncbi:hypothetical protein HK100_001336 [Physocladia obscura]|uniref:Uncharacterized protein n=1 Tax=Physocladia obscura TaxID=109957 RepID=A0AAD5TDJ4_9FUNG|nr:hypothetical protein HK100_001336 [Physocladia obscura]